MLASPGQSPGSRHIIISSTQTATTRGPHMELAVHPALDHHLIALRRCFYRMATQEGWL